MKKLFSLCSVLAFTASLSQAQIAQWTFQTSVPLTAGPFSPELGSGAASGSHAGTTAYSSPAGNGSSHSFSANGWAVNDYWQFQTSTVGFTGIQLEWDQVSSSTGPRDFKLQYSTDGSSFATFGADYTVLVNTSPTAWSSTVAITTTHYISDLSSIPALDNASAVYFRLVDDSTTSAGGGTVASTGTDRVDNFTVEVIPVPEPACAAVGAVGLLMWGLFRRRN
jgi:hypothetical protein